MSQENVEVVRRALEALAREEMEDAVADLAPDAEMHDYDIPDASVYRGPDGFLKWLGVWGESWESWRFGELEVLPASEDRVIALFRMAVRGHGSGVEIARRDAVAYTLRGGKIVRMEYYNDQRAALEAVGLSEQDAHADS
jgi:ketosteroid isomerase-like protein